MQRGTPPTSLGLGAAVGGGRRDGVQEGAGWTAHAARRLPRRAAGWGGQEAAPGRVGAGCTTGPVLTTPCALAQIFEKKPLKVKNFGIWMRYNSRTDPINMYKEYRDVTLTGAVSQMCKWHTHGPTVPVICLPTAHGRACRRHGGGCAASRPCVGCSDHQDGGAVGVRVQA